MSKKAGRILMIAGAVITAAALVLAIYNKLEEREAFNSTGEILGTLEESTGEEYSSVLPLPETLETVTANGYEYIGTITIPAIDRRLPVMDSWSYPGLKISPCLYSGNLQTGLIIAAHNYDCHFGKIKNLCVGDSVYFTDVTGRVYEYCVAQTEILKPYDVEELESEEWALTLFTCTYGGKTRVVVRCNLSTEA